MDGSEARDLPARHVLRLPRASPGQQPPLHGAVRPPDKPLQRKDIHDPVVLDGICCGGEHTESDSVAGTHAATWRQVHSYSELLHYISKFILNPEV